VILKRMEGEDPFFPQKETVVLKPYLTYRISVLVGSEVYEARVNNRQYGGIVLGDVVQIVLHHGRFLNKKYAEIR
jgi:hypothetical protein